MSLYEGSLDQPDAETLLRRVHDLIANAKSLPLSTSVRIEKDEVLELLARGARPPARGAAAGPLAAEGAGRVPREGAA